MHRKNTHPAHQKKPSNRNSSKKAIVPSAQQITTQENFSGSPALKKALACVKDMHEHNPRTTNGL